MLVWDWIILPIINYLLIFWRKLHFLLFFLYFLYIYYPIYLCILLSSLVEYPQNVMLLFEVQRIWKIGYGLLDILLKLLIFHRIFIIFSRDIRLQFWRNIFQQKTSRSISIVIRILILLFRCFMGCMVKMVRSLLSSILLDTSMRTPLLQYIPFVWTSTRRISLSLRWG